MSAQNKKTEQSSSGSKVQSEQFPQPRLIHQ